MHAHPADRRTGMLSDVGQRLADDLVDDFALRWRQQVLRSAARNLDPDRVKARELFSLVTQIAHQAFRPYRSRPQLGRRLTHLLEHPLEDLEDVDEGCIARIAAVS